MIRVILGLGHRLMGTIIRDNDDASSDLSSFNAMSFLSIAKFEKFASRKQGDVIGRRCRLPSEHLSHRALSVPPKHVLIAKKIMAQVVDKVKGSMYIVLVPRKRVFRPRMESNFRRAEPAVLPVWDVPRSGN